MNAVDPPTGEIGERSKVLLTRQPLRLETSHLASGSSTVVNRPAADNLTQGRAPDRLRPRSQQAAQTQIDAASRIGRAVCSCRDGRLTAQLQQARSIQERHPVPGTGADQHLEPWTSNLRRRSRSSRRVSDSDSPVGCAMIALDPIR